MKRYIRFFWEDSEEQTHINTLQDKIKRLKDKESAEGLSDDDKQKYRNQINQIQNQITKLKDRIKAKAGK